MPVLLGTKAQCPLRLVAIKLPNEVVAERKRKLGIKKKTDHRKKYDQAYITLLGWSIFITNVEQTHWTALQVLQAYGFRWRIESIFRCWKSHFHLTDLCNKGKFSVDMTRIFFYYMLCFITLFWHQAYHYWFDKVLAYSGRYLSIFKFVDRGLEMLEEILEQKQNPKVLEMLSYFAVYDQHVKRGNFMQDWMGDRPMHVYEMVHQ